MSDAAPGAAGLSPSKRALLESMLRGKRAGETPAVTIPRRADRSTAPLSFAQARLWFIHQIVPASPAYNVPAALRLRGSLDVALLARCLTELTRRHESLRTRFETRGDAPVQIVDAESRIDVPLTDLSALPPADREAEARRIAAAETSGPFDLSRGPLLRARVLKLAVDDHVLLLTMHHIVSDGWSMGVLVREVAALYEAFGAGRPSPLPEMPIQYADFSAWQRDAFSGERLERELEFWRERLTPLPDPLDLPADRPRPAVPTFRGGSERMAIDPGAAGSLRAAAREEGATPFMALLAAFDLLLARHAGQSDVAVGTVVANRGLPELEGLIGFFVNTLVVRVDASGDPSFRELIARTREATLGAFAHEELPFERLVEELNPARDLGRNPIFQIAFAFQNAPADVFDLPGLSIAPFPFEGASSRFDLELHLWDEPGGGISGSLVYAADLFDAESMRDLASRYVALVSSLARDPARRISRIHLLAPGERERLLVTWNDTARDYPRESSISGLFEEIARARPDDLALVTEHGQVTYGALLDDATAIARGLRARGVGAETRVALAMDRSPDLIAAVLGVLRAGGVYVPLDADAPPARITRLLAEAAVSLVLTDGREAPAVGEIPGLQIDELRREAAAAGDASDPPRPLPDQLAYVMFTSGSTGHPKGIEITHRNVVRLVRGTEYARFGPDQTILQMAPVAFDASTFEIWGALLNGGRLAIAPPGVASPAEIARLIARFRVSFLWLTAGLFRIVVDEELHALAGVAQVLSGGDVVSPAHVRRLLDAGCRRFVNGYGPTETTTAACCEVLHPGSEIGARVPVGPPISTARVYVLDNAMQPVPTGAPGELFIGGDGVARGYAGRPDLTADRFVPDPFGPPGSRLYRTGDVTRWNRRGRVEFLGRRDGQVKIRGFRVEIAEIEAAIAAVPEVRGAVVAVHGERGEAEIVAYVIPATGSPRDAVALRRALQAVLPRPMIPSRFLFLDAFPLTANGKIDRRALPAPEGSLRGEGGGAPPRTATETEIARVWADLLKLDRVAVTDNFFDLGGHSLLATQVASRLRSAFGVEVPLRAIFESPTVEALAGLLDAAPSIGRAGRITRLPRPESIPLSFAQARLWFLHKLVPGMSAYNIPNVLRLEGDLDVAALGRVLGEIVRRHEALRTRFVEGPDGPRQVIDPPAAPRLDVVDLAGVAGAEEIARRLVADEALAPFDLERGPLVRARVVRLADRDHLFLLTMHHIVSDGWSMGVLVREVAALYEAFAAGRPSPLPDLPLQYADFSAWQRRTLAGERLENELAYWRERLQPLPPPIEIPADHPRPTVQTFRSGLAEVAIPAETASAIRALSEAGGGTLFMGLLAAFDALLSRLTGETDVAVGTGIANRTHLELEPLIGFFVNTLVLRLDVSGDPTFRELLARARETTLGAFAHQDLPFEKLVEELHPTRDLGRNPIFQIAFALQNAPQGSFDLPGLSIGSFPFDSWTTRFDLELHLWDDHSGGLGGSLFYSSDLYDEATARRLVDRYTTLLASIAGDPDRRISELRMAARDELEIESRLLSRGAPLEIDPAPAHRLFEARAARAPEAPAVEASGRAVTYGDLDARAGALSGRIRRLGIGRGDRVAILAPRSIEHVIAALAVMKSGAAYVPIDPANPAPRIDFMLSASGTRALLAPRSSDAARHATQGRPLIEIDAIQPESPSREEELVEVSPADLAYVIFTSGSTGEPNGVEVTHGNLSHLVAWHNASFGVGVTDRATLVAGTGFDASVWEMWPYLASGACLLIPDETTRLDPEALRDWLVARRVTISFLPTPLAEACLALDWPGACDLRVLLTGGDRLHAIDVSRFPFRVVNNYGPTETTVVATSGDIDSGAASPLPSIGRPIANARAYVLDGKLRPAPLGAAGELFIAGAGVARGYTARPDLTAERFLPDPFEGSPSTRMYRTGDRVRRVADGRIEFLGRADGQVKIRGHRIEPGEIEAILGDHPAVESAAVIAREDEGGARLVAYVVPRRAEASRGAWEKEHIERWRDLYDVTYRTSPGGGDPSFNITGWNSSYTGEPIDPEEMREWRERTVERILALSAEGPHRVLEIGCGTGLLLTQVAPRCERYVATDFSRVSLECVRVAMGGRPDLSHVVLHERLADDFRDIEPGSFDTVVLNSVVQYFPDASYLERVLEGAVRALADGGCVFVGDVRDARLQRAFAASVALHGAADISLAEARERMNRLVDREEELLVSPAFFAEFAARQGRPILVEAVVKRGRADNELTRFRYDATLRAGVPPARAATREITFDEGAWRRLDEAFRSDGDEIVVRGVPNARVAMHVEAARLLGSDETEGRMAREVRAAAAALEGIHPDDAAALAAPGWTGVAGLSRERPEAFDVLYTRQGQAKISAALAVRARSGTRAPLTNLPLRSTIAGALVPALAALAAERLPEVMVPSAFVVLDRIPLTPNGKLDRRALPPPAGSRAAPGPGPPASTVELTPLEAIVAQAFEEILGVRPADRDANFFELGGHSLLATSAVSRLRRLAGVEVPLRAIFEAPSVRDLALRVGEALRGGAHRTNPVAKTLRAVQTRASFQQERMWFLERFHAGNGTLAMTAALRLSGDLNAGALDGALSEIERRHEALRTRFESRDGVPYQMVDSPRETIPGRIDLTAADDPESELRAFVEADAAAPFDLERGPVWRASLVQIGSTDHVLVVTIHHIVSDGWSMNVLVQELSALYEAHAAGAPSPLAPLPIQYADYAIWQRTWLESGELERQVAYWREELESVPLLQLPTDRPRPPIQGHRGSALMASIDGDLADRLRVLARAEGATLHMVLLAGYALVLSRWSGQEDFAVGVPIAGRTREETEGLIGYFVNTLAIRVHPEKSTSFSRLVAAMRAASLGAYAHQDVPFESVLSSLKLARDLARSPVFQVWFNLLNTADELPVIGSLAVRPLGAEGVPSEFDLSLYASEEDDGISLRAVYATEIFEGSTIREILRQFVAVLRQAASSPGRRLDDFSLVTEEARGALPDPAEPLDEAWRGSVHEIFARIAQETPSAIAVADEGGAMSYADLEGRANQAARWLMDRGVSRGDTVAIYAHRSAPTVVAVLGTIKAGAAFALLDPAHPTARLVACLSEIPPRAVIAVAGAGALPGELASFLESNLRVPCLTLPGRGAESGGDPLAGVSDSSCAVTVGPDDLACVTFTSGSTGKPKAVRGRHGSLTHFQPYLESRFGIGPEDRFSMISGLAHDPLQRDIFTPLLAGASVRIPDPAEIDPARLAFWAARERVTVMNLTPAMSKILAPSDMDRHLPDLRLVFLVGEQLTRRDVERLRGLAPKATIVNLYGTTETQRAVGHLVIPPDAPFPEADNIPAGIGMPGAQLLVRTDAGSDAGLFEVGEIWIRSPHLALGYVDPESTLERFSGDGPARAYRTGDLGRYLHDGAVAVAGRRDGQMNVRGFRIEPGEVEAALAAQPGVRDAVALLDSGGRLIAYVSRAAGASLDPASLREAVRSRLPDPMVPAAIVVLDAIPLTPNGKVDRSALPDPAWSPRASFVAPRTADEEAVCAIIADVLDLDRVSADDSFFDLGGHSLLATRLLSRLRAIHGVEIPLRSLFEAPTPAGVARSLGEARRLGRSVRPRLARADAHERRKLSYAQRRLWILDRLEPGSSAYNVATALRLKGRLDAGALSRAVAELERRHESLTARIVSTEEGPEQIFAAARREVLVVEDVSRREDPEGAALRGVAEEAATPFDLARGPLWRVTLFRIADGDHALSIVLHHVVTDGWSNDVLAREVSLLYAAFAEGKPSPLDDLPFQYADWAAWQRRWLEAGEMDRQLAWWRRELDGAAPVDIPIDRPRSAHHGLRGESLEFEIDRDDATALSRFSRSEGTTLFQILLACFHATLARHAASGDVIVGTPIANRDLAESEPIVGFFANTLPVRARIDLEATLRSLIASVRERVLEAYAHQDAPFEEIVSALDLPRDLSRNPLFDAMFLLQHAVTEPARGGDLTITPLDADPGATPFDLTLAMAESDNRLFGSLAYDADLFDRRTARILVDHFAALVRAVARTPDAALGDVEMRSSAEIALIEATNATVADWPARSVGELVEERARISGEDVAVIADDAVLTYADLDARANRIARRLRRAGAGPEAGVALIAGRSAAAVAGILGIFKSGGAYVPLDASLPKGRLATMLDVAGVKVILAGHGLERALPPTDLPIVRLDSEEIDAEGPGPPPWVTLPSSAAYVIFTSGSTGEPKGSVVEHRAIAERTVGDVTRLRIGPGDRALYFNAPIFDVSLTEILPTLASGAAIVVHPDPRGETPADLLARLERHGVTIADVPIGFFHEMVDEIERAGLPVPKGLRFLDLGGESPSGARFAAVLRAAPWLTVVNGYGPTETVITATARPFTRSDEIQDPVPIGVPLANTTVHLLDARMRPVPLGAFGEIYIGGLLARGYAARPAETAWAFVPDPFSGEPGARLYRTGDLARRLADGSLVFAGRRDGQIKLRGYRIEIAEIEAALVRIEGVREAAVSVIGEGAGRRLVGYVATGPGSPFDAEAVQGALRERLPDYMIPRDYVALESMPRTATGKLDRRALPLPEAAARRGEPVDPRDDLERILARLWGETLPGETIDVERSFFESGGNSLLAVRLVSAIRRELEADLPVAAVFQEPTIAGLARALRGGALSPSPLVTLKAGTGPRTLVCVHEIAGGIAEFRAIAGYLDPRRPVFGIQGISGSRAGSIEATGARYARSIAREVAAGAIDLLGWSYGGLVAVETARELRRMGREVGALILLDAAATREERATASPMARAAAFLWGVEADSPDAAVAAARESGNLPAVVADEDAKAWVAGVASRLVALEAYRPEAYPGDVVLVRAAEGAALGTDDPTLGWGRCVTGELILEWAPGSHYSMVTGDGARAIAAIVEKHVARARG